LQFDGLQYVYEENEFQAVACSSALEGKKLMLLAIPDSEFRRG
jgi:hypothetical protein